MTLFRNRPRLAQSLAEVLVAVVFLATGGLAVYSGIVTSVSEGAWQADRVFAQGLLRDLVETYSSIGYCELTIAPEVKPMALNDPQEDTKSLEMANKPEIQKIFEEEPPVAPPAPTPGTVPVLHFHAPLMWHAFHRDPSKPTPKADMEKDPIYRAYRDTMSRINARRVVLLKDMPANNCAIVTCIVWYKSGRLDEIPLKQHFVKFKPKPDAVTNATCP